MHADQTVNADPSLRRASQVLLTPDINKRTPTSIEWSPLSAERTQQLQRPPFLGARGAMRNMQSTVKRMLGALCCHGAAAPTFSGRAAPGPRRPRASSATSAAKARRSRSGSCLLCPKSSSPTRPPARPPGAQLLTTRTGGGAWLSGPSKLPRNECRGSLRGMDTSLQTYLKRVHARVQRGPGMTRMFLQGRQRCQPPLRMQGA